MVRYYSSTVHTLDCKYNTILTFIVPLTTVFDSKHIDQLIESDYVQPTLLIAT
jgi:hypothetical protein